MDLNFGFWIFIKKFSKILENPSSKFILTQVNRCINNSLFSKF